MAIEKHIKNMKSKIYIQNLAKYPEMTQKLLLKLKTVKHSPDSYRDWFEPIACPDDYRVGGATF